MKKNITIKYHLLILTAVFLVIVALVGAGGLRRSHQYWHIADVDSLVHGSKETNDLYPGLIMLNISYLNTKPFIHNILTLYLIIPFAYLLTPYWGWIAYNICYYWRKTSLFHHNKLLTTNIRDC